jgi:hypothetical protein
VVPGDEEDEGLYQDKFAAGRLQDYEEHWRTAPSKRRSGAARAER